MTTATRIPVLMYHRIGEARNNREARYAISAKGFASHMQALACSGYRAVSIEEFLAWLSGALTLPERAFVLTFDDGFRSVHDEAMPVLERLRWPCTVFIVSDLIGGEDVWVRASNPADTTYPLLDAEEIRDLQRRGCSFHSHTRSHVSLPAVDDIRLADELRGSRERLAELTGQEVRYLAYPFGHVDARVEAAARTVGYTAAFVTQPGFNRRDINRFRIRRLDVFGTDTARMLMRKIRFGCNDGRLGQTIGYSMRRLANRLSGAAP